MHGLGFCNIAGRGQSIGCTAAALATAEMLQQQQLLLLRCAEMRYTEVHRIRQVDTVYLIRGENIDAVGSISRTPLHSACYCATYYFQTYIYTRGRKNVHFDYMQLV